MFSEAFDMVESAILFMFNLQGVIWDQYGVLATFLLVFVAATFFRFVVVRMFGAGADAVASDMVDTRAREVYGYRERVRAQQRIANYQARKKK